MEKVVHLVPSFGCGGLEKVIVNLVNNSKHYNVRHVLISLTTEFGLIKEFNTPIDVYCIGKKPGKDISSHFKLFKLLKRIKPAALHTYNFGTIEYHLIAKLAGVRTTVHCDHGRGGDDPQGRNQFNNRFRRLISRFIDHYIVVSYDLFNWVVDDIGVDKNKVQLIFNGVDIPLPQPNLPSLNRRPLVIATVGRLDPIKNQTMLMDAFALAKRTGLQQCEVKLRLIGDGPIYQELMQYRDSLPEGKDIELLGYRSDINELLQQTDIFALSSHYEAMPMTILESMALKVPVVTTDVGGIAQFISPKQVWFVPANDKQAMADKFIALLCCQQKSDIEQKNEKITEAYQLVTSTYSVDSMVAKYMELYQVSC